MRKFKTLKLAEDIHMYAQNALQLENTKFNFLLADKENVSFFWQTKRVKKENQCRDQWQKLGVSREQRDQGNTSLKHFKQQVA